MTSSPPRHGGARFGAAVKRFVASGVKVGIRIAVVARWQRGMMGLASDQPHQPPYPTAATNHGKRRFDFRETLIQGSCLESARYAKTKSRRLEATSFLLRLQNQSLTFLILATHPWVARKRE